MEPQLPVIVGGIAVFAVFGAALFGWISERSVLGAFMLASLAAIACGLCVVGAVAGGWIGLGVGIVLGTLICYQMGRGLGKAKGSRLLPALWLAFCASSAAGYWVAGWFGLLIITLPAWLFFGGALIFLARALLPLEDKGDWPQALRCLLTYTFGTNYPYLVQQGRELDERVPGNPYGRLFAGPGIVLTDAAHVPVIWNGLKFQPVAKPGLTFTKQLEVIFQTVDLRVQHRAFTTEAITQDGIRVRIPTFFPFRLQAGGLEPELGKPFPMDPTAILRAMRHQPVEQGDTVQWADVVPIVARRLLRKIISEYRFDELCEPFDPGRDPRVQVRNTLVDQVGAELDPMGIEIVGGGIGNIEPENQSLIDQRIKAWRAEWERKIMVTLGEAEANAIWEVERAHVRAQAELLSSVRQIVENQPDINADALSNMAALRFIEALEEMACRPEIEDAARDETSETIEYLRKALE